VRRCPTSRSPPTSSSDDDFRRTLSLIEEAAFDWAFVFKYSPRQGTPAAGLDAPDQSLIEERHQDCLRLVESIGRTRRQRLLGRTEEVLVEETGLGRTRGNYKVLLDGDAEPGQRVRVSIVNAERATLEGALRSDVDLL
jgi:tRNA-2-methylthio-N6-dimethylallyladenosine synthase